MSLHFSLHTNVHVLRQWESHSCCRDDHHWERKALNRGLGRRLAPGSFQNEMDFVFHMASFYLVRLTDTIYNPLPFPSRCVAAIQRRKPCLCYMSQTPFISAADTSAVKHQLSATMCDMGEWKNGEGGERKEKNSLIIFGAPQSLPTPVRAYIWGCTQTRTKSARLLNLNPLEYVKQPFDQILMFIYVQFCIFTQLPWIINSRKTQATFEK